MKILYINDKNYNYIKTIEEYTSSFTKYSSHNIKECTLETFKNSISKEIEENVLIHTYNLSSSQIEFIINDKKVEKIIVEESDATTNLIGNYIIISSRDSKGNLLKNALWYFIVKIEKKNTKYILHISNKNNFNTKYIPSINFQQYGVQYQLYTNFKYKEDNDISIKDFDILLFMYDSYFQINKLSEPMNKFIKDNFFTIYFIQDEYQYTNIKSNILKDFNVDLCFVNVNEKDAPIIFNNTHTIFKTVLTGYIPDIHYEKIPIKDRKTHIFYRATPLPYIYGDLGQEKTNIGKIMKKYGLEAKLTVDIEWDSDNKVFGEEWYNRLRNTKTTLATECGCRVFEHEPRNTEIQKILETNPNYTYEEAKKDFKIEPMYTACQVSPKMFEASKLGTVLIMYEGEYKGIFKPNIHYIELKKDHSNINDVIEKIKDDEYLQNMADRAYKDIVVSGNYTYKDLIEYFDSVVKEKYEIR